MIKGVSFLLLFFLLVVAISSGIAVGLGYSSRPRPLGWLLFTAGAVIAILTVCKWANALPAIFGVATLNAIIILITGHALNQPSVPVPRMVGALLTIVMAGASVTTASSADRDPTNTGLAAYLGILSCFVAMVICFMESVQYWKVPVCIVFIGCIAALWTRRVLSVRNHRVHT